MKKTIHTKDCKRKKTNRREINRGIGFLRTNLRLLPLILIILFLISINVWFGFYYNSTDISTDGSTETNSSQGLFSFLRNLTDGSSITGGSITGANTATIVEKDLQSESAIIEVSAENNFDCSEFIPTQNNRYYCVDDEKFYKCKDFEYIERVEEGDMIRCLDAKESNETVSKADCPFKHSECNVPVDIEKGWGKEQVVEKKEYKLSTFKENFHCAKGHCEIPFYFKSNISLEGNLTFDTTAHLELRNISVERSLQDGVKEKQGKKVKMEKDDSYYYLLNFEYTPEWTSETGIRIRKPLKFNISASLDGGKILELDPIAYVDNPDSDLDTDCDAPAAITLTNIDCDQSLGGIVLVGVSIQDQGSSTATYDGQTMTEISSIVGNSGAIYTQMFYYQGGSCDNSANNAVVTFTGGGNGDDCGATAIVYTGVNSVGTGVSNKGTNGASSVNVTPASASDWVVDAVSYNHATGTIIVSGDNVNQRVNYDPGNQKQGMSDDGGGGGNVNMSWNHSTSAAWSQIGVPLVALPGSATSCGTITSSITLTADVSATGTCYTIGANDITLNCARKTITYGTNGGDNTNGVSNSGYNNTAITNCTIKKGSASGSSSYGIYVTKAGFNNLTNNDIKTNGTDTNLGIYLFSTADNNTIYNNNITTTGTSSNNDGIYLNDAEKNNVTGNTINTNGTSTNDGIDIISSSYDNIINKNSIKARGTQSDNYGVYLVSSVERNNITNNDIKTNGTSANYGIYLLSTADNNTVYNNNITTTGTSSNNYGIYLNDAEKNNITGNTINTNGTSTNDGIDIDTGSYDNIIDKNSIKAMGTATTNEGIYLTSSERNNITNNDIKTNGTSANYGILFSNTADNNTIYNNNITTTGTSSNNYGIYLNNAENNLFNNNNISTNGTSTNHGINITSSTNNIFLNNNITTKNGNTITDATGGVNYLIYNNSLGQIAWTDNNGSGSFVRNLNLNVSTLALGQNMFIGNNTAALNTSAYNVGKINSSTNITLYTLNNWSSINQISFLSNYSTSSSEIRQKGTNCTNCFITSFSAGTLLFNVTAFSSYAGDNVTAAPPPSSCGTITTTTTLINDVSSTATCFTIGASSITLDCNGFGIKYGTTDSGYGVNNTGGYTGVTVKNCKIMAGMQSVTDNYGIYFKLSANGNITNNSIYTNGSSFNYGVLLDERTNFTVINNNTITTSGTGSLNIGVYLLNYETGNNLTNNIITTNGTASNFGIFLNASVNNSLIHENTINTRGTAATNYGIYLRNASDNNNISTNTVNVNGTGSSYGIFLRLSSDYNTVYNNTIKSEGKGSFDVGIYLLSTVTNNNITNNSITTNGSLSNYGMILDTSVNNSIISGNTISTTGTSNFNFGIYLLTNSGYNNVSSNTINTNGTNKSYGIALNTDTNYNVVNNNNIKTFGKDTISSSLGIFLTTTTTNNNITNNIITTNGTSSNYGIDLETSTNNTIVSNNSITTTGTSNFNYGISLFINSGYNNVSSNTINTNGTDRNYGIYLTTTNYFNNIINNKIFANGTGNNNHGMVFNDSNNNTLIDSNNITAGGTDSPNYAIYISRSSNNIFINNNFSSSSFQDYDLFDESGDTATNYFIYNNSLGEIRWTNETNGGFLKNLTLNITNGDGLGLGRNLFIGNNTAALNTTAFNGLRLINQSANITLYTLNNWSSINQISFLSNYSTSSSEIRQKGTNCTNCFITSFSAGTLLFNVTAFSSYAGTNFTTSEVANTRPTTPGPINPANSSITTNLTPTFRWYNSTDADADPITYNVVVDTSSTFNNPVINVTNINPTFNSTNTSYDAQTELSIDTLYYWKVAANDSTGYGTWSSTYNFTVQSFISLSITTSTVDFGTLSPGDRASTNTSGFAPPFRIINSGNILMNVTINGTEYFTNATFPGPNYKYRVQPNMTGSFNTARSDQNWTNMSRIGIEKIINLDWHSISNDFVTDINITVPVDEPSGLKTSTVSFVGSG